MCLGTSCDCNHQNLPIADDLSLTLDEREDGELVVPKDYEDNSGDSDSRRETSSRYSGRTNESSRTGKRDAVLKDQQSTGRKRAARMYPLDRNAPCEWRGKTNCGGGKYPVLGCIGGNQQARHHGPDKSVSNNEPGNVHRICHNCHYRWHAANDPDYDWNETSRQEHSPRSQTQEEQGLAVLADLKSASKKKDRARVKD